MTTEYLETAKYCRKHGKLPQKMQLEIQIASGTPWDIDTHYYPKNNINEDFWREPFIRRFGRKT